MKVLIIAEYRDNTLLANYKEALGFAERLGAETVMMLFGSRERLPAYDGKLYLADAAVCGEYNPDLQKNVILQVIDREQPDMVVLAHSSYGWDLAPRLAYGLGTAQVSEVVDVQEGALVVPVCNAKLRRTVKPVTAKVVVTLQAGAFKAVESDAIPEVEEVAVSGEGRVVFQGYEVAEAGGVDLTKAEVIVSAGRGIGKPENVAMIAGLAKALGGEYGASRPVVDSAWVEHNRQVGTTGQTVSPKLYVACGISGAIQHLAGMKKSDFVVAVNTDKDAPIGEVADVLVVADLLQFVPVFTEKLQAR